MPSSLKPNELSQWTEGDPDLTSNLLLYLFYFMKVAANKGKDVNGAYEKVDANIRNFISVHGEKRLHIPVLNRASVDASALLGAYLRQEMILDGKPIVELSEEQIQAVYDFVKPLIPDEFTPKQFLDSLTGSPAEKHVKVLKMLLFKGISAEDQTAMSKTKYAKEVENLLDSVLKLVAFMRTPFNLLDLEEIAAKALAKKLGKAQPPTSGMDLQWASLYNAIDRCLNDIITKKRGGHIGKAEGFFNKIKEYVGTSQKCFGIANAAYKVRKEVLVEIQKQEGAQRETFKALGFPDGNPETISQYINNFRKNVLAAERNPEKHDAIRAMSFKELVSLYGNQWQAATTKASEELAATKAKLAPALEEATSTKQELVKIKETLVQKTTALEQSDRELRLLKVQFEQIKIELDDLKKLHKQQNVALGQLQQEQLVPQKIIEQLRKQVEEETRKLNEKNLAFDQLNVQLQAVKKENEELKRELRTLHDQEQTIIQLREQVFVLQRENESLKHKKIATEDRATQFASEDSPEVAQLKSQIFLLQRDNESLRQQPKVVKQTSSSASDVSPELSKLRTEIAVLRQENTQLKKEASKANAVIPEVVPRLPDLTEAKSKLLVLLGSLRLNVADTTKIQTQIIQCSQDEQLMELNLEIQRLEKINDFIETINKGILERAGFFSSDPYKKTRTIETAFQQLTIKDKYRIATLSEAEINEELSKEDDDKTDVGKFLKAINHKRGFIPIHQATSFTFFKNEIGHLKQELEQVSAPKVF